MKIIDRSFEVLYPGPDGLESEWKAIERAARTCYQSMDKITNDSYKTFCKMLLDKDHGAMLEFGRMRVKFITDRAVANEFVRHRFCSFAQESTRYVNYKDGIPVIRPSTWDEMTYQQHFAWIAAISESESSYKRMIESGCKPQIARGVLPLALKTELIVEANFREWIHIFKVRADNKAAHPDMIATLKPLVFWFRSNIPVGKGAR